MASGGKELEIYLTGKIASCAHCCGVSTIVDSWVSKESPDPIYQVRCGVGCGCTHNICTKDGLEAVLNAWNKECDEEGLGPDYATRVIARV